MYTLILQLQEDTLIASQLQVYENAYAVDLAATQSDQLELHRGMQNIKKDNISFKNALDKIMYSHPVFQQASSQS